MNKNIIMELIKMLPTVINFDNQMLVAANILIKINKGNMLNKRVCYNCESIKTPMWRRGPNYIDLCNKCGLKWSRGQINL